MDTQRVIATLSQYPFVDIEKVGGSMIQKQIKTSELTPEMIKGFALSYGKILITPKRMMGNSPLRVPSSAIEVDANSLAGAPVQNYSRGGLNGFKENFQLETQPHYESQPQNYHQPQQYQQQNYPSYQQQPMSGHGNSQESGLYKILYDGAIRDLKDMTAKYEAEREKRHAAEIELSGSKNSVVGDIAQGLSGVLPAILGMNGGGASVGMGEAPQAPAQQPQVKPITDPKLSAIVKYYATLDPENKDKVYNLLAKVFTDLSLIDTFLAQ